MLSKSQIFTQYDHPVQMEPLLPADLKLGALLEQANDLIRASDQLAGKCQAGALDGLRGLLRAMNSYYTNRIEGQHTLPVEIEQALRNEYAPDADKARRQRLALSHMASEQALEQRWPEWSPKDIWSTTMVQNIHQDLFARLEAPDRLLPNGQVLEPGALRTQEVSVGRHAAPLANAVPQFLDRWGDYYARVRRGEMQVLAIAASHHRLAWIHPFADGNGRVARLHTHLALGHMGLTNGLWSPLRAFARSTDRYYTLLDAADQPRAGDLDGRGNLSEKALCDWLGYVVIECLDQVRFMSDLLNLGAMRDRIAACLGFEENVVRAGVRSEALAALHYLFATQGALDRGDFKALLGLGERLATAQVSALLKRGLLVTDSAYGKLRFGVPQHALRFYFPGLWPEAEGVSS
jgi:Fic family protein